MLLKFGKAIETVQLDVCKLLLGVEISTNNSMLYAELPHVNITN